MIKLYLIFLFVSGFLYFILFKLPQWKRIAVAVITFIVLISIFTFLMIKSGDKPTPQSRVITKEMINKW